MGKNQSASGLTNIIQYDSNGNISFVSGSTTLMSVSSSGAITTTGVISGSSVQSSSLAQNSNLLQGTGSVGFVNTGSFSTASGSVSSRITQIENVYATTGSNSFRATQSITGSLTVTGQIIAQTINVQQVTSSIVYSSGSNVFGCDINSRQTFTGSFYQTGSIAYFGGNVGIGALTPNGSLEICKSQNCALVSNITNFNTGTSAHVNLQLGNSSGSNVSGLALFGGGYTNSGLYLADGLYMYNNRARGGIVIATEQLTDIVLATNSVERLRISSGGNVGIGTTSPTDYSGYTTLHVNGKSGSNSGVVRITAFDGSAGFNMYSVGAAQFNTTSAVPFIFLTRDTERMRITDGGNVGIGTSSPTTRLFVLGSGTYGTPTSEILTSDATIWSSEMTNNAYNSILQLVSVRQSLSTGAFSNGFLGFSTIDDSNGEGIRDAGRIAIVNETGDSRNSPTALGFWTNPGGTKTTAATEKMRITSAGTVGIGTTTPGGYILALEYNASSAAVMSFKNLSASGYSGVHIMNNSGTVMGHWGYANASTAAPLTDAVYFGSTAAKNVVFTTSDAVRMTILSGGNVGINTTSPGVSLHVNGIVYAAKGGSTNNVPGFQVRTGGGGPRIQTYGLDADANAWMGLGTDMAGNPYEHSLYFSNAGGGIGRQTIGSYNGTTYTVKMTILDNGSIGAPTGTNIYNPSDVRLKQNVITITNGLNKVMRLNPVKFNWIEEFASDEQGKDMLGFIAQEVEAVIPEAVEAFSNGSSIVLGESTVENPLRVNEKFIIPVLVKAIQEQQCKIALLESCLGIA